MSYIYFFAIVLIVQFIFVKSELKILQFWSTYCGMNILLGKILKFSAIKQKSGCGCQHTVYSLVH